MPVINFIWDQQNYLAESDGNNVLSAVFTNEPRPYGDLVSSRLSTTAYYHHFDGVASTRQLTLGNEGVSDGWTFNAWGNVAARIGATPCVFLWAGLKGYYFDSVTGTYSVRARTYNPSTARWCSPDPLPIISSGNLYRYAQNKPLDRIDPTGQVEWDIDRNGCKITLIWTVSLRFVNAHAKLLDDEDFWMNMPGWDPRTGIWGPPDPKHPTRRQEWNNARIESFKSQFAGVVEGCWNAHAFKIKPTDQYGNSCVCPCLGGWTPRLVIKIGDGSAVDTMIDVAANSPVDNQGIPSIQSWVNRPNAYLDEADLESWPERVGDVTYSQITACHEFGHMIGIKHPGTGDNEYTADVSALMGLGSELRPPYFEFWETALPPQCAPYKIL